MIYLHIFDVHLVAPEPRELVEYLACLFVSNRSTDGVVRAANPALGLELQVCHEAHLRAPHKAVVSKLILHLSEENSPRIHIRLRQVAMKQLAREACAGTLMVN